MRFRSDIQGLRAIAVISVLLFHFGASFMPGGFTGVDVFFTISGFVISTSILSDLEKGRFSIADFYFKRIRRIFPSLFIVLLVTTIFSTAILLPEDLKAYNWSLLSAVTFWSNVFFWKSSGYFASSAQILPLLHTWSLSIEEQFYLFAPMLMYAIHKFAGSRFNLFLWPCLAISLLLGVLAIFVAPTAGFFLLPTRAWQLLLGVVLAFNGGRLSMGARLREILGWAGLFLIALGLFGLSEGDPFPGWNALLPSGGAALILCAGCGAARLPVVGRLLSTRPFLWIGNISYSLYLVHWPIAALYRYVTLGPPSTLAAVAMFLCSMGIAALLWRYVEEPFRHISVARRGNVLGFGALAISIVAVLAVFGIQKQGFPARFPDYARVAVKGTEDWGGEHCFNTDPTRPIDWDAKRCTRIRGKNGRILLWGDSFAAQYTPGILRDSARINADVVQYTFAGCPPILSYRSYARVGCAASNQKVLDIIGREGIDTVVMSARWSDTPSRELAELYKTIRTLKARGVRVVVFGQSPQFLADVQQIDYISGNRNSLVNAEWPVAVEDRLNQAVEQQALKGGAQFINPISEMCRGKFCEYREGRKYLFEDFGHFSAAGSILAVKRYFPSGNIRAKDV
jgi:peptidoglycan/LPS O-acetylase OafA/YrhL